MPQGIRRFAATATLTLVAALNAQAQVATQVSEEAAVRATIQKYIDAQATGNGDLIREAFHPELRLMAAAGDTLAMRSAEVYANGFRGMPARDESQRKRWIAAVDVFGTAAAARVVLDYPSVTFVDFFTLVKLGDEWKIVTKTYAMEPKPRP